MTNSPPPLTWLEPGDAFPPVERAWGTRSEAPGLLAAGGDLSVPTLRDAYSHGIFPWFSEGQPILWWSPDPRMVLVPEEFRLSRSLAKRLRQAHFEISTDTAFRAVMQGCAETPRPGQNGTWIVNEIIDAYSALHELGFAHSVECWQTDDAGQRRLVGGLYGVCLGRMFYGESMFSHVTDSSKAAFASLVRWLRENEVGLIDCQMKTAHLASLGAKEIPRREFLDRLTRLTAEPGFVWPPGHWNFVW